MENSNSYRLEAECLAAPQGFSTSSLPLRVFRRFLQSSLITPLSFVGVDMAMVLISLLSVHFVGKFFGMQFRFSDHMTLMLPMILATPFAYVSAGLYPGIALNPVHESRRICFAVSCFYLLIFAASTVFLRAETSQVGLVLILMWMINVVIAPMGRLYMRAVFSKCSWWGMPTVVIGHGEHARSLYKTMQRSLNSGLRPSAIVDVRDPEEIVQDQEKSIAPVYGLTAAPFLARQHSFGYAVLAAGELSDEQYVRIVNEYADSFGHLIVVPEFDHMPNLWIATKEIAGKLTLELSQPLAMRSSQITKRAVDLILGILVCVMAAPLLLTLYLLVRCTSRGPVFFGHPRIGRYETPFRAWKFRTMVENADQILRDYLEKHPELRAEWERDQKLKKDPRVTFVGRFMRKLSLDELPQIWNVLRGDMSIVGPRPIVTKEIAKYGAHYAFYQKVRPGITGLWQVSGRNNTTYEERVAYDEYYVRNWSAWLDLYILFRTIRAVLFTDGAY